MKTYQFQSITTERFLDFLKAELPEVFEKVDVQTWVYRPGMPETWHKPQSHLFDEVEQALADFKQGKLPAEGKEQKSWHRYDLLSCKDCQTRFQWSTAKPSKMSSIWKSGMMIISSLFYFYATCILSGYREIIPHVEKFVERIGRDVLPHANRAGHDRSGLGARPGTSLV